VLAGETIAEIWWGTPVLARQVQQSLIIADFRTLQQDLELAIDQVVETGIRALSPAINDTFTGLMSIDWLGESVRKLAVEAAGTP
jgi:uncharacterized membrane protein